jgi:hypothetical protein
MKKINLPILTIAIVSQIYMSDASAKAYYSPKTPLNGT